MRETSTGETCAFVSNIVLDGAVENWLVELEKAMINSMQKLLAGSIQAFRGKNKEKWITDVQGQLLITTGAIQWTNDCSKALNNISGGQKNALRQLKKKQVGYLTRLTDMIRGQLPKLVRKKLVALPGNRPIQSAPAHFTSIIERSRTWRSGLSGGHTRTRRNNCIIAGI